MNKERVIGSYLLRFTETKCEKRFYLQNLRTGDIIEFETWISAWAFLEQELYPTPHLMRIRDGP